MELPIDFCKEARRIAFNQGGLLCVRKDGECTMLYWHLSDCDDCQRLRDMRTEIAFIS